MTFAATYTYDNPRQRAKRTEEAFEKLRHAIVTGELRPNQRLVQSELAKQLGMSRTPIHVALQQLQLKGYVTPLPKGGMIVTDHTANMIQNLYQIREALETTAIRLACQRANKEQLDKAEEYHKLMIEAVRRRDFDKFVELNSAFHNELYAASGNEQLCSLIQSFRDQPFDRRIVHVFTARDWQISIAQHERILEAVRKRDAALAERVTRRHLRKALKAALERL